MINPVRWAPSGMTRRQTIGALAALALPIDPLFCPGRPGLNPSLYVAPYDHSCDSVRIRVH